MNELYIEISFFLMPDEGARAAQQLQSHGRVTCIEIILITVEVKKKKKQQNSMILRFSGADSPT
jgi:hypothetical protein